MAENRIKEHLNSKSHNSILHREKNQPELTQGFVKRIKVSNEENNIALDLVKVFIYDNIPFSKWTNKGSEIKSFLFKYAPQSRSIPTSSHCFTKYIPIIFSEEISKLKFLLSKSSAYNLIIDESPSKQGEQYLNILVNFITGNHVETKMLCSKLMISSTAASLALAIGEVLNKFEIDRSKIFSITCDSAAYNKKLVNDLKQDLPNVKRIPCFTHILNVAIKASIKKYFDHIFQFCMRFSSKLKVNKKFSNLFQNEYESLNIPKICEIRWYSFYNCLSKIWSKYGLIKSVLKANDNDPTVFNMKEILKIENPSDWETTYFQISLLLNFLGQIISISKFSESNTCPMFEISKYLNEKGFEIEEKTNEASFLEPKEKFKCLKIYQEFKKYFFECLYVLLNVLFNVKLERPK